MKQQTSKHRALKWLARQCTHFVLLILIASFLISATAGQALRSPSKQTVGFAVDLVQYPNEAVAFICGPQLKAGSKLNPFPWFDTTALEEGIYHGEKAPRVPPFGPMAFDEHEKGWRSTIAGRVSVSWGTAVVTGKGTRFKSDVDPAGPAPHFNGHFRIRDAAGVIHPFIVRSIESDTSLTLATPWSFASVNDAVADTYYDQAEVGTNADHFYLANYYDSALVQYINYYRTGDKRFLGYARKIADAWWHSQYFGDGTLLRGSNHLPPRSLALAGLMLRALDGRPEMWDYIERTVRETFQHWVYSRKNNPGLYYDIREDGYLQLYAVLLAKALPDTYPLQSNGTLGPRTGMATDGAAKRASYLSQTEDVAVNFFGRLQRADGSWRWNEEASKPDEELREIEQPFMVGLYLESVTLLHQLTRNHRVKANLLNQLTRSTRHLYLDAYQLNNRVTDLPQYRWRSMFYFWGGGSVANPRKFNPPPPKTSANGNRDEVAAARHFQSTLHHAFGYAYHVTGDKIYKEMGDEIFDASFGDQVDGIHSLAASGKAKDYDMNYRASGRYLAWRLTGGQSEAQITSRPASVLKPVSMTQQIPTLYVSIAATPELHISGSLIVAKRLSTGLSQRDDLEALVNQIATALRAFRIEQNKFVAPEVVIAELDAALAHARTALSMLESASGGVDAAKLRIGWAAARLKRAKDRVNQK